MTTLSELVAEVERLTKLVDDQERQLNTCDEVIDQLLHVPAEQWDATRTFFLEQLKKTVEQLKRPLG